MLEVSPQNVDFLAGQDGLFGRRPFKTESGKTGSGLEFAGFREAEFAFG